jgi:hypothetical protein
VQHANQALQIELVVLTPSDVEKIYQLAAVLHLEVVRRDKLVMDPIHAEYVLHQVSAMYHGFAPEFLNQIFRKK